MTTVIDRLKNPLRKTKDADDEDLILPKPNNKKFTENFKKIIYEFKNHSYNIQNEQPVNNESPGVVVTVDNTSVDILNMLDETTNNPVYFDKIEGIIEKNELDN